MQGKFEFVRAPIDRYLSDEHFRDSLREYLETAIGDHEAEEDQGLVSVFNQSQVSDPILEPLVGRIEECRDYEILHADTDNGIVAADLILSVLAQVTGHRYADVGDDCPLNQCEWSGYVAYSMMLRVDFDQASGTVTHDFTGWDCWERSPEWSAK